MAVRPRLTGGIYDPSLVRLLVRKTGSGSGGVRTTYGEIDCSADCSSTAFDFRYQAPVWLEVSADDDSTFAGWGGACATSGLRGR